MSGKEVALEKWPVLWIDQSGKTHPLIATPRLYLNPRLSPDGKRLAVAVGTVGLAQTDIWVYDLEREALTKLTFADANHGPVWSPDGKYIAYQSQFKDGYAITWIRADGAGEPRGLSETKNFVVPYSFSPEGRNIAFFGITPETGSDICTLSLDVSDPDHPKPGKPAVFLRTHADETTPVFSPEGRWMAYSSTEVAGTREIYVRPFVGTSSGSPPGPGAGKWLVSTGGGSSPVWSLAGRQLVYGAPDGRVMVADYTVEGNSFRSGNLHVMMLVNFFDELRRRMPPGEK